MISGHERCIDLVSAGDGRGVGEEGNWRGYIASAQIAKKKLVTFSPCDPDILLDMTVNCTTASAGNCDDITRCIQYTDVLCWCCCVYICLQVCGWCRY